LRRYCGTELDSWTGSSLPESGRTAKRIHTQSKTSKTGNALASDGMSCHASPTSIAAQWLAQLDAAIEQRQAKAALALFTADARLQVRVLRRNGTHQTVTLHRDELVESTWVALSKLSNYRHQRNAPEAEPMPMPDTPCPAIRVRSEVEESGQMNGQAYRMRSIERYVLEYQSTRAMGCLTIRNAATIAHQTSDRWQKDLMPYKIHQGEQSQTTGAESL
jgi:hypothetical protein